MRYIPHTDADVRQMLDAIGVDDLDALFAAIPEALQLNRPLDLPPAMAESDLRRHLSALAAKNTSMEQSVSFLGGGVYRHDAPIAVDQLLLRGEIYTAYTPYQPEIAQGTLQIMFEFQTMASELLAMDVVNASMYDGSTAVAEAALMALRIKRKAPRRIAISTAIHPHALQVCHQMVTPSGGELVELPWTDAGVTDLQAAEKALSEGVSALIVGYPTFLGTLDDLASVRALCDDYGALMIVAFHEAQSFGLLKPPGEFGADIVCGEGQSLGIPASFGGPHLGLFGTRQKYLRQMPGRLCGKTVDSRGQQGFVLTMSTREQHIRREKATSNICTNQGLLATCAAMYMTMMGPGGLSKAAKASHLRAKQTRQALTAIDGVSAPFGAPYFNEFVVVLPSRGISSAELVETLAALGIAPGIALGQFDASLSHHLLVAATELTTDSDIERMVEAVAGALKV